MCRPPPPARLYFLHVPTSGPKRASSRSPQRTYMHFVRTLMIAWADFAPNAIASGAVRRAGTVRGSGRSFRVIPPLRSPNPRSSKRFVFQYTLLEIQHGHQAFRDRKTHIRLRPSHYRIPISASTVRSTTMMRLLKTHAVLLTPQPNHERRQTPSDGTSCDAVCTQPG